MKRLLLLLIFPVIIFALTSCDDEEDATPINLDVLAVLGKSLNHILTIEAVYMILKQHRIIQRVHIEDITALSQLIILQLQEIRFMTKSIIGAAEI